MRGAQHGGAADFVRPLRDPLDDAALAVARVAVQRNQSRSPGLADLAQTLPEQIALAVTRHHGDGAQAVESQSGADHAHRGQEQGRAAPRGGQRWDLGALCELFGCLPPVEETRRLRLGGRRVGVNGDSSGVGLAERGGCGRRVAVWGGPRGGGVSVGVDPRLTDQLRLGHVIAILDSRRTFAERAGDRVCGRDGSHARRRQLLECPRGVGRALEPIGRPLGKEALDPRVEPRRHREDGLEWRRGRVQMAVHELVAVDVAEWSLVAGEAVGDDPERIEVGPRPLVAPQPRHLLGRHVAKGSGDVELVFAGAVAVPECAGDSEVRDLDPVARIRLTGEEHVGRLEIAMQHAARVGVCQRIQDVEQELAQERPVEHSTRGVEGPAGDQLHRQVGAAGREPSVGGRGRLALHAPLVEEHHDVAMVQPCSGADLVPKGLLDASILYGAAGHDLHGDRNLLAAMRAAEHLSHATPADWLVELERAQLCGKW